MLTGVACQQETLSGVVCNPSNPVRPFSQSITVEQNKEGPNQKHLLTLCSVTF